jgi:hypothetical protein
MNKAAHENMLEYFGALIAEVRELQKVQNMDYGYVVALSQIEGHALTAQLRAIKIVGDLK